MFKNFRRVMLNKFQTKFFCVVKINETRKDDFFYIFSPSFSFFPQTNRMINCAFEVCRKFVWKKSSKFLHSRGLLAAVNVHGEIIRLPPLRNVSSRQCDQMVWLFFNIWSLVTMNISPKLSQICQSRLNILPNKK